MESIDRERIAHLDELVRRQYVDAADERHQLHEAEWAEKSNVSLLGEMELLADLLHGTVKSIGRTGVGADIGRSLADKGVWASATVREWFAGNASSYPKYSAYIQSLEHLRLALLEILLWNE